MTDKVPESFQDLFGYCCKHVNEQVVAQHCPGDPGYKTYVREWSRILAKGQIPEASNFEISETVGMTMRNDSDYTEDFLRFRCFTNSVALQLITCRRKEVVFDLNYPLVRLLSDTIYLQDKRLLFLLKPAFESSFQLCGADPTWMGEFVPWWAYGLTLLAACRGDEPEMLRWAMQTITSESKLRHSESGQFALSDTFLFGVTGFDSLCAVWIRLTNLLLVSYRNHEPVALILDALSEYCVEPKSADSMPPLNEKSLRVFRT